MITLILLSLIKTIWLLDFLEGKYELFSIYFTVKKDPEIRKEIYNLTGHTIPDAFDAPPRFPGLVERCRARRGE